MRGDRVLASLRQRLTYANVMSTLAVFLALGGSSYAALQIDSADIANNSVRGVDVRNRTLGERDIKRNALGGRSIRESRLGRVPRARNADRLGGMTAADFLSRARAAHSRCRCLRRNDAAICRSHTALRSLQCATTDVPPDPDGGCRHTGSFTRH